jgi:hypothetical protein
LQERRRCHRGHRRKTGGTHNTDLPAPTQPRSRIPGDGRRKTDLLRALRPVMGRYRQRRSSGRASPLAYGFTAAPTGATDADGNHADGRCHISQHAVVIIMGVSGSAKSTIGSPRPAPMGVRGCRLVSPL